MGIGITIPKFLLVSLLVFGTVNSFYVDKGFYLFYILSFPSLMTLATRIHKIGLSTLYREENNKLHSKFTLTKEETTSDGKPHTGGPDIHTCIYIMYRYL